MEKPTKTKHMPSSSRFAVILLYLMIKVMSSGSKFAYATDTLLPGQFLSGNQTLLSKNGAFKLGFDCLFPPCGYDSTFGIWYIKSSACRPLLVWSPLGDSTNCYPVYSSFGFTTYGNLELDCIPVSGGIIPGWSSYPYSSEVINSTTSLLTVLLDNGNLVIRDPVKSSLVIWQSFDNPIGTLLPGGWLGFNRNTSNNIFLIPHASVISWDYNYGLVLAMNPNQGGGFIVEQIDEYVSNKEDYHEIYHGTFPSWMGIHQDGGNFLLFSDARVYVQLNNGGTITAAKLGECGSVLWSAHAPHIHKIQIVISTVIVVLTLVLTGLVLLRIIQKKSFMDRPVNSNSSLTIFSNAQIKKATGNFSVKLGEGGFGCVFKGTLQGSSVVAVKKLKEFGQGEKQFRAEVQTIGMIQHINVVRLFGFCAEGSKRLLVYEYMENGSLSSHLFSKSPAALGWEVRYRIALGTARGLAYLHEGCTDCIIHCDMKPDNVLLDADFCPKVADFGLAKLLGRDFSRALTTMRGTIGYLAPEWISGLPITHKADVYSYGMMLLEIVSGRRNAEKIKQGRFTYFPIFAAVKVNEGDVMCLLDSRLEDDVDVDVEQLIRACRTACWCIQDAEDHRPMMGQVVQMLEGVLDVQVPPVPRSLQNWVGMDDCSRSTDLYSL
ncbi:G-type lectin S-receptor-like serine/threonine-protein kinase At2g19130 [Triticum urartu]|nr:G-type lectin S-receptor-like serine/threonine-protein kinase At2g19130 [Triticum urartu]